MRGTRPVTLLARLLRGLALLLLALAAGFFYAYSCCVVWGLDDTPPAAAIEAMQGINRAVRNPIFALVFFGALPLTALACLSFRPWRLRAPGLLSLAALLAYGGTFIVTAAIHVPMNQALAVVDAPALADPAAAWRAYADPWLLWNHVRAACATLALVLLALAAWLHRGGAPPSGGTA